MHTLLIIGGVTLVCAVLTVMLLMYNAAEGYEDDDGFHLGKPPEEKDHSS